MYGFFKALTRVGAVLGFLVLVIGINSAKGAPQEAAAAALAMALALLPYVVFRTIQVTRDAQEASAFRVEVLAQMDRVAPVATDR